LNTQLAKNVRRKRGASLGDLGEGDSVPIATLLAWRLADFWNGHTMRAVRRLPTLLVFLLLFCSSNRTPAQQGISEEEKRRLFLKAREEMTTIPYTPPEAKPTPKPKVRPPVPTPPTPHGKPPVVPAPTPPKPPTATPKATPIPKPTGPLPPLEEPKAPIIARGSGVVEADDDEKEEPAAKKDDGFFSRIFGSGKTYKYLTPAVRRAIDQAEVRKGRWRYIVVHNSGTRQGNAAAFEHYHRYVRKMPNGLAYHFVIGNGTSSGNGKIEIGNRWSRQIQGGHVHSDFLNNIALGICYVGDFNNGRPTKEQMEAAEELIGYLRKRVGKISGHPASVRPHKAVNPARWPTDCPGGDFPYKWFERFPD
jgi:hypothetical protein